MTQTPVDILTTSLTALGFEPTSLRGPNVRYRKSIGGRDCTLLLSHRSRTKYYTEDLKRRHYVGHQIVIEIPLGFGTRLTLENQAQTNAFSRFIFRRLKMTPVENLNGSYSHILAHASDQSWAHSFLTNTDIEPLICAYLIPNSAPTKRVLAVTPDTISLSLTRRLTHEAAQEVGELAAGFEKLIQSCGTIPAPLEQVTLTRFERFSREHPILLVVLFFTFALSLALLGALLLFALALSGLMPLLVFSALGFFLWKKFWKKPPVAKAS